jgi:hypothetical protein
MQQALEYFSRDKQGRDLIELHIADGFRSFSVGGNRPRCGRQYFVDLEQYHYSTV